MFLTGTPIDFTEAERYLKCASLYWATLAPNGVGEVVFGQLNLLGTDEFLNVFSFDSFDIYGSGTALNQLNGINIVAPLNSTILITIYGINIQFASHQIFRNGVAATREQARKILWNFPEALTWSNSTTAIYGSVLAPFAAANTTYSQINGNIIFNSFTGNSGSHNELFIGELPDPLTCLLTTTTTTSTTTTTTTTTTTSTTSTTTTSTTTTTTTTSTTTTTILNDCLRQPQRRLRQLQPPPRPHRLQPRRPRPRLLRQPHMTPVFRRSPISSNRSRSNRPRCRTFSTPRVKSCKSCSLSTASESPKYCLAINRRRHGRVGYKARSASQNEARFVRRLYLR